MYKPEPVIYQLSFKRTGDFKSALKRFEEFREEDLGAWRFSLIAEKEDRNSFYISVIEDVGEEDGMEIHDNHAVADGPESTEEFFSTLTSKPEIYRYRIKFFNNGKKEKSKQ